MENQIFKDQTLLTILLETGYGSLAQATETKIYYQKPDRTKGSWTATVDGTKLKYEVQSGDLNQDGEWQFQAAVTISGRQALGTVVKQKVYSNIKPI